MQAILVPAQFKQYHGRCVSFDLPGLTRGVQGRDLTGL